MNNNCISSINSILPCDWFSL